MKKLLVTASIIALAAGANAAKHSKKTSVQPFENYYGVISGGYSSSMKVKGEFGDKKMGNKAIIGLGLKTDLCDNMKVGLNLEYRPIYKSSFTEGSGIVADTTRGEFAILPLTLNGSYEFKEVSKSIIPYVEIGAGVAQVKTKGSYTFTGTNYAAKKDTKYNFTYNAGLGAKFPIMDDMNLGLGYKFSHFGKVSTSVVGLDSARIKADKLRTHDFIASLEVKF